MDEVTAKRLKNEAIKVLRKLQVNYLDVPPMPYETYLHLKLGRPPTDDEVWHTVFVERDPALGITWYD